MSARRTEPTRGVSFSRFCELVQLAPTPGQSAFAAVAYDGKEPSELEGAARDLARSIFGDIETIPAAARAVIVQVKGRDVGGSRFGALRLLPERRRGAPRATPTRAAAPRGGQRTWRTARRGGSAP